MNWINSPVLLIVVSNLYIHNTFKHPVWLIKTSLLEKCKAMVKCYSIVHVSLNITCKL